MKAAAASAPFPGLWPLPHRLRRGAILAVSRGTAVAMQMGVQVALGAVAGPAAIGLLQVHMAWTNISAELIGAGEATRALRDTAVREEAGDRASIGAGLRRSSRRIAGLALVLAAAVLAGRELLRWLGGFEYGSDANALILAVLCSAPLLAGGRVFAEALKALNVPIAAISLENLVLPMVLLFLCALLAAGLLPPTAVILLGGAITGMGLAMVLLRLRLNRRLGYPTSPAGSKDRARPLRRHEQLFFWLTGLLNIAFLQLPFLLLPWIASPDEIGRLAVAHKLVNIVTTLLILLAALYGPRFALAATDAGTLRRLLFETQRLSLLLIAPLWLCLMLAADPLARLFSLPDASLLSLLLALGVGQLVNAATGLSGVLLTMSGGARLEFQILLVSTAASLLLILAGHKNIEHVAAAIAAGIALRNLLSFAAARFHIARIQRECP